MAIKWTAEELEELRRFDEEVDASPMTADDYAASDLIEEILFPEASKKRQKTHEKHLRWKKRVGSEKVAERNQKYRDYSAKHKEQIRERRRRYYLEHREEIRAKQKDQRARKRAEKLAAAAAG